MTDRLISAEALKKAICNDDCENCAYFDDDKHKCLDFCGAIIDIIDSQPTAYDVDEKIKQLEDSATIFTMQDNGEWLRWIGIPYQKIIDIVRKGGGTND